MIARRLAERSSETPRMLEHRWDGKGLRVIENGREIKRAGDPWQVKTSVPWLITYPLGQKALKAAMVPEDPRLRSLWEHLGSFF